MKMSSSSSILVGLLALAVLVPAAPAAEFMVVFDKENLNPDFVSGVVENAGGTVIRNHANIGVALIDAADSSVVDVLRSHNAVEFVAADQLVQRPADTLENTPGGEYIQTMAYPENVVVEQPKGGMTSLPALDTVTDPTQASFYNIFQWNLRRIQADDAWALGHLGDPAVSVAVLDTGLDYTHQDLNGNVDLSRSASFVPEDDALLEQLFPGSHPVADLRFNGSFVASQIGCNAVGTACVAPNVTLIGVKVLNSTYDTTPARIVAGIDHATSVGADIIVFAYTITLEDHSEENRAAIKAIRRAIQAAVKSGAIFITEAGVSRTPPFLAVDLDTDGDNVLIPGQASGKALVISASGIDDQFSDFNFFGESLVDLAAPGGAVPFLGPTISIVFGPCSKYTQFNGLQDCQNTPPDRYMAMIGSIPATGMAAGVAALIDSLEAGAVDGKKIRQHLIDTSDDILDPGFDGRSGHGRINALKAVTTPIADD